MFFHEAVFRKIFICLVLSGIITDKQKQREGVDQIAVTNSLYLYRKEQCLFWERYEEAPLLKQTSHLQYACFNAEISFI